MRSAARGFSVLEAAIAIGLLTVIILAVSNLSGDVLLRYKIDHVFMTQQQGLIPVVNMRLVENQVEFDYSSTQKKLDEFSEQLLARLYQVDSSVAADFQYTLLLMQEGRSSSQSLFVAGDDTTVPQLKELILQQKTKFNQMLTSASLGAEDLFDIPQLFLALQISLPSSDSKSKIILQRVVRLRQKFQWI